MKLKQKIIIGALIIIALILGLNIYNKRASSLLNNKELNQVNTNQPTVLENSLTEEEKKLFTVPSPNATEAEKRAHFDLLNNIGKETGALAINGCKSDPQVLKVKLNQMFRLTNSGTLPISFGFDKPATINPKQTISIKADFKNGVGIYGYSCDDKAVQRSIGFVMVTPEIE